MISRLFSPPKKHSFFLFGARGTGKSTLLKEHYNLVATPPDNILFIDLLDADTEERFSRAPQELREILLEDTNRYSIVIVDEVQKVPALLDVIHQCIERYKRIQFIMTGSSARKLKHGGANLLGGRAFSFMLHPFTFLEAPNSNNLTQLLAWGSLPRLYEFTSDIDRIRFLRTYTQTYLKQEIQLEQFVRNIVSFREFLDLAAQTSGEILNCRNIAGKSGVDEKTITRYFEILIDTLVGFFLEPFDESVRVRQSQKPKFYLFDTGVKRFLTQMSDVPLRAGSSEYGALFEQWIVCEVFRLNDYFEKGYRFYYLRTKDGAEIDLIVQKPGKKRILIEIKSTDSVGPEHYKQLVALASDIRHQEKWVVCNEKSARMTEDGVRILPWRMALRELFGTN